MPTQTYPATGYAIQYGDTVKFQWSNTGAGNYQLVLRDTVSGTVLRNTTKSTFYSIKFNTTESYTWQVRAFSAGAWSNFLPKRALTIRNSSLQVVITSRRQVSTGKILIQWNTVSGATKYGVYVSTNGTSYSKLGDATIAGAYVTGLSTQQYWFFVQAYVSSRQGLRASM